MDYSGKKILVFGWAKSGKAAAQLLLNLGAEVFVTADQKPDDLLEQVEFVDDIDDTFDLVVKNPGIKYTADILVKADQLNIPVLTEVQVALDQFSGDLIAITGSNGKTTTSLLIWNMLKADGFDFSLGGNIGTPVSQLIESQPKNLVLELSSFQLMGTPSIHPKIAVITNIYTNHIDYHQTRENYVNAKLNIARNQNKDDFIVINENSKDSQDFGSIIRAQVFTFSSTKKQNGAYFDDSGKLIWNNSPIITQEEILLKGKTNHENIAAATTVAKLYGVSNTAIRKVLTTFEGVEHRMEFVGNYFGRDVYNDSKATDIEATQSALNSFVDSDIVWIAGGLERGDDLSRLKPNLKSVKTAIFLGETKTQLKEVAQDVGISNIELVDNLEQAVNLAIKLSSPEQKIIFSPAAASWDMYPNFEVRGNEFKELIKKGDWQ